MPPPILTLPDELTVELFSYLHPRDIAACQRSCRQFNDTIIHSQLLQYLIRIGRSGLYDPLFPTHTVSQRIDALEKWESAWNDVETKSSDHIKYKVTCPFAWRFNTTCRIHDDFLIVVNCFDGPGYGYVDLRTFQPGEKCPLTVIANHSWRGKNCLFAVSVEQDLVLAVLSPKQNTSSMFIELHGIRFSQGTPHPSVVGAVMPTVSTNEFMDVVIVGDRTILNVSSFSSQRIFLHSWKDGHVCLLRETSKPAWSHRFVAISLDMIALVETEGAALDICRIVEEPDGRAPSLRTNVRLGLPPLSSGAFIRFSSCMRESVPTYSDVPSIVIEGRPPRHPPFHSSPEDGLVVVIMSIGIYGMSTAAHVITIVTHLRSLVALATTTPPGVTFIPWENWGPRVAACFKLRVRPKFDVLLGGRLATIWNETLSLFDFNPTRIRDAIQRTSSSSGRINNVDLMTVNHISVIPRGMLFKEDVVGELPYISVVKPASTDWKILINYEEELAGLSWNFVGSLFYSACEPSRTDCY